MKCEKLKTQIQLKVFRTTIHSMGKVPNVDLTSPTFSGLRTQTKMAPKG